MSEGNGAENRSLQIEVIQGNIATTQAEALIVNLFEGVTSPGGGTGAVDQALDGMIGEELRSSKAFTGKLGTHLVMPTYGKIPARYVVVVGLGKMEDLDSTAIRRAAAVGAKACQKLQVSNVASILHGTGIGGFDVESAARLVAEGTLLGTYKFDRLKKKEDTPPPELTDFAIVEADESKVSVIEHGVKMGQIIARAVNRARDWVFDSPNNVTPTFLKLQAQGIPGLRCEVLEHTQIKNLGMGAFDLVAKGSDEPPYLIHLSYKPKSGKIRKRVALVGKGITFDSGGLSLKPAASMELMKMDMAGAAAVICTMGAIAELMNEDFGLDIQVDAFVPTCENMPSGRSSKPGDVVRAMNGKTVEVNNTDAEGRLILCDALTYAQKTSSPDEIIDIATLTGACIVALGKVAAGIMGHGGQLIPNLIAAGEHAGEKFWELPLFDEYKDKLKSDVADLINAGSKGEAGSSMGGMFLKEFVDEERSWAHLDIAGPAWIDKEVPEVPKGASGFGVRTLLYYLYEL